MTARLDHPNIVPIYEVGQHEGDHFISLKFIEGGTLAERLRNSRIEFRETAALMAKVARAVHFAHQRGVLHRDLKPSNILLTPAGEPMVTDFGLAKLTEADTDLTHSASFFGTPSYVSPEQAEGGRQNLTTGSDVYSLGAILYELLVGEPPFRAESSAELIRQVRDQDPVPPRRRNPLVPRDIETICLKCLRKEPPSRYLTADELANDLDRWRQGEPIAARPTTPPERFWRWCRRQPILASLSFALALVVVTALFGISRERRSLVRESYRGKIAEAEKYIQEGDIDRAKAVLFSCPEANRHWEWGHLMFLCHQEIESFQIHSNTVFNSSPTNQYARLQFNGPGTRLHVQLPDESVRTWDLASGALLDEKVHRPSWTPETHQRDDPQLAATQGSVVSALVGNLGKVAVSLDADRWLRVRRNETNEVTLLKIKGNGPRIQRSFRFSSNDRFFFNGGTDQTARLWNITTGHEIAAFPYPTFRAVFSPDGELIATFGDDYVVRTYRSSSGNLLRELRGHALDVLSGAFSTDNSLIATADRQGVVKVWSAKPGRHRIWHPEWTYAMDLHPDGNLALTTQWDASVTLWDLDSGGLVYSFLQPYQRAVGAKFSPDGRRFAIAGSGKRVDLFETSTGKHLLALKGHNRPVYCLAFHPSGRWLASGGADRSIRVWDLQSGNEVQSITDLPSAVVDLDYYPEGTMLAASSSPINMVPPVDETEVLVFETSNWSLVNSIPFSEPIYYVRFNPDGERMTCSSQTGTISIYDVTSDRIKRRFEARHKINPFTYSADGQRLIIGSSDEDTNQNFALIDVWTTGTKTRILSIFQESHSTFDGGVRFTPDDLRLVSSTSGFAIKQWEAFPWSSRQLGKVTPSWPEHLASYARRYWRERIRAESSANSYREPDDIRKFDRSEWPRRAPETSEKLIDLSAHYNAFLDVAWITYFYWVDMDNDLSELPRGVQQFHDVPFDIRGLVKLRYRSDEGGFERREAARFPPQTSEIAVGMTARRIHLLHGISFGGYRTFKEYILEDTRVDPIGTEVANLVLNYADGTQHTLAIRLGEHVVNWWSENDSAPTGQNSRIAWRGTNRAADRFRETHRKNVVVRLCQTGFDNPFPDREIRSLNLVSGLSDAEYFLIAVTVDP